MNAHPLLARITIAAAMAGWLSEDPSIQAAATPLWTPYETVLTATSQPANPYVSLSAEAVLDPPGGGPRRRLPLFWDGGRTWKLRFSPDKPGVWRWTVQSKDPGLDGQTGGFEAAGSGHPGRLEPMARFPHHFSRQDGAPFWFLGDTAWALFTDSQSEHHDRAAAFRYLEARARQGFNVVHSMLLSEAGWGNAGGPPFLDLGAEQINPAYWQEVDLRIAEANRQGIVCGLALAWGDKRKVEPFAWRRFPSVEARHRYARYIAARYSALDVYFIVSGEWHAEIRTRPSTEDALRQEFVALGNTIRAADPHGRMAAIHPMTSHGSVREFNPAPWMAFGDYQQNYRDLHARALLSRSYRKPVVNSEYGYFLRDQDGDGVPDKDNSTSIESMRHATWDIVMAGGYPITGFGTTYFGGNRDPGPFDLEAEKNRPWELQIGLVKRLFTTFDWWKLEPQDDALSCAAPRGTEGKEFGRITPPRVAYWCLAELGRQYVIYVRGLAQAVELEIPAAARLSSCQLFNPRTGELKSLPLPADANRYQFVPPDDQDWLVAIR
ncbi:MAG: DUF4038 domain-containing protein [Verrucomicrobia bacterium]|nr:DUF4038 domain-containing protein [Verrucomicrobiota bacterium]